MNSEQTPITDTGPEIVTTRIFNVSKELLFKAYTDAEILADWWGPKGFSNTFHEFNQVTNGEWNFTMYGPDGKDYKNKIVFREIVPLEKIVFDHASGPYYRGIVTFTATDEANQTRLIYSMTIDSYSV